MARGFPSISTDTHEAVVGRGMSEEKRPTARAPWGEIAVALIDSAMFTSMPATLIKMEEIKASVSAETPLIVLINLAPR